MSVTDITVRTANPHALDETLQQLGGCAAVVIDGSWSPGTGTCQVRVFGGLEFLKFALKNQGYGEVVE